jgi:hypothetical protein
MPEQILPHDTYNTQVRQLGRAPMAIEHGFRSGWLLAWRTDGLGDGDGAGLSTDQIIHIEAQRCTSVY